MVSLENLQYFYALFGIIFSIINCSLLLRSVRRSSDPKGKTSDHLLRDASIIGITFFLTNLFVVLALNAQVNAIDFVIYFLYFLFSCIGGSFLAIKMGIKKQLGTGLYLLTGFMITVIILLADYSAVFILFNHNLNLNLPLVLMTGLITLGISFSSLRFLLQLSKEPENSNSRRWEVIGSLAAGLALSGIPYLTAISAVGIQSAYFNELFLFPYAVEILAMTTLAIVPDLFGEYRNTVNQTRLETSEQHFSSLFDSNPDSVFSINLDGRFISVNKMAEKLTGYTEAELLQMTFIPLIEEKDIPKTLDYFLKAKEGIPSEFEVTMQRKDGISAIARIIAVPIIVQKEVMGVYGIAKDITEFIQNQEKIRHLVNHDELTGHYNSRKFIYEADKVIAEGSPVSILSIEIGRIKSIREVFGIKEGDGLLREASSRLKYAFGGSALFGRLNGDEFALLIRNDLDLDKAARQIGKALAEPFTVDDHEIFLECSIGAAIFPDHGKEASELLRNAENAKRTVSKNDHAFFAIYERKQNQHSLEKIIIENELKKAIENDELLLYYQPKYNISKECLTGFEALVRWKHPEKGILPPGVFIPVAEQSGLIAALELWVLKEACFQLKRWNSTELGGLPVSINLSQKSFSNPGLVKSITRCTEQAGIDPSLLEIEITESLTMFNEKETIEKLHFLKEYGMKISLDDFGTGYSSLSYIDKLPIDTIKIDKSFIDRLGDNGNGHAMVSAIISMSSFLKLHIIAEGVETKEQADMLSRMDCHEIQGYYFSPPKPAAEIEREFGGKKARII
ncbi:EAL domain-containing protein [Bacillus sp. AG4(2022)]|uniref:putative bifunctional diguanylate cyclase/phosphodiesterase n=1 Tax=Bacillus sp. AG4(2022) TaxID=2962594 RepID=UPI002880CDFD|nr:EAL domain-containing protein [Bacillus sp. AG4(2022)]MDT0162699.1 EAL domain-containing protein [Bacillus sp. AG4(2022)]